MAFPELQKGEGNFLSTIHQLAQRGFYGALELGMINDGSERAAVAQAVQEYGFHVGFGAQRGMNYASRHIRLAQTRSSLSANMLNNMVCA